MIDKLRERFAIWKPGAWAEFDKTGRYLDIKGRYFKAAFQFKRRPLISDNDNGSNSK